MNLPLLPLTAALAGALALAAVATQDDAGGIPADTEIQTTDSGLKYSVLEPGEANGARPKLTDTVTVHYTGWLTDGTKFDSSRDRGEPSEFKVGGVIEGWQEGLGLMTVGSRFKFTIPGNLAYGEQGSPPKIPADATLVFDVELFSIEPGPPVPVFQAVDMEQARTEESGLVWQSVVEGEGESPKPNETFLIDYAFWTTDGELVSCSDCAGGPIMAAGNNPRLPKLLTAAPQLLKPGGVGIFHAPAEMVFGDRAQGKLPANSPSIWRITLRNVFAIQPTPAFVAPDEAALTTTESGLQYEVVRTGSGKQAKPGSKIVAHYAGWLEDGTPFDDSYKRGTPFEVMVGQRQVIAGWDEGLALMREGDIWRFKIPAGLAYGAGGRPPTIPGGATLIFQIELIAVM